MNFIHTENEALVCLFIYLFIHLFIHSFVYYFHYVDYDDDDYYFIIINNIFSNINILLLIFYFCFWKWFFQTTWNTVHRYTYFILFPITACSRCKN